MSTTDANTQTGSTDTESDDSPQIDDWLHLLTDDTGACCHIKHSELRRELTRSIEVTEIANRTKARDAIDDVITAGSLLVTGDTEGDGYQPSAKLHLPSCEFASSTETPTSGASPTTPSDESPPGSEGDDSTEGNEITGSSSPNEKPNDVVGGTEPDAGSSKDGKPNDVVGQADSASRDDVEPRAEPRDEYTRALENRVDELEETVDHLTETIEAYEQQLEQVTHGLTELQANQLARGGILSRKGTDVDRLNSLDADGLDFDVNVAGDNEIVRADNTEIGESGAAVNELPDFEKLISLEADRQRLQYGIFTRDDFDTAVRRRAVDVWQDIHVLNSNKTGGFIVEHRDLREKVRSILEREGNPQEGETLSETTRRVRRKLVELSDDVLKLDQGSRPYKIVADPEDVKEARVEDGTITRDGDGDAMVLNGGK